MDSKMVDLNPATAIIKSHVFYLKERVTMNKNVTTLMKG